MPVKKVACIICGKKFHPKSIFAHRRKHKKDQEQIFVAQQPMAVTERELGYKQGYQVGQEEQRRRMGDARIALVESVAKLNQALAGVLDNFRQG